LLIVTGSTLRAEEMIAAGAYLRQRQGEVLSKVGMGPSQLPILSDYQVRVIADFAGSTTNCFTVPTISGGPGVNALAHRWL
jgi:hypothetical protein